MVLTYSLQTVMVPMKGFQTHHHLRQTGGRNHLKDNGNRGAKQKRIHFLRLCMSMEKILTRSVTLSQQNTSEGVTPQH